MTTKPRETQIVHELKTWPEYFNAILDGSKTFEYRRNDRGGFRVGDVLHLREYDSLTGHYSGREMRRRVTYVLPADVSGEFVVMAISELLQEPRETQIEDLIQRWREAADFEYNNANREYASALDQCASDLESALLREEAPAQPVRRYLITRERDYPLCLVTTCPTIATHGDYCEAHALAAPKGGEE